MDTNALKIFAKDARRSLIAEISAKMTHVLAEGSPERREAPSAVGTLEGLVKEYGKEDVVEKVAYTWFNRLSALRYMDANGYNAIRVVSPAEGGTRPEILSEAIDGNTDKELPDRTRERVQAILSGREASSDRHGEAYRLLLVATCNRLNSVMPFMFERIADYTELLLPADLLSNDGILSRLRDAMTIDACKDVEVIGWLYQFYISEKKDAVFAGLKKNIKITAANIPAATQLFTPHWIVRYLVENSLGRLWMLNHPSSKLIERMDYYIVPVEPETDFLRIASPEEIRICDPACGSGHMLTYAFDLLHAIYEEEGYDANEIPALILANNLTGIEIDERAGALAAFALAMKAVEYLGWARFQRMKAQPDVCVLQNVIFTPAEMQDVLAVVGEDLFSDELRETLGQFEQAKNFGSLIVPKLRDPVETLRVVEARDFGTDLLLKEVRGRLVAVLRMAEALSPKYHIVVANPPYAGTGSVNGALSAFSKENYPNSKADLFSMFIDRNMRLSRLGGCSALVTMQSWLFLSAYERLRGKILGEAEISSLIQIGYNSFPELNSKVAQAAAFVLRTTIEPKIGSFINLNDAPQAADKDAVFRRYRAEGRVHFTHQENFDVLPGKPIAYWISDAVGAAFADNSSVSDFAEVKNGMSTTDNARFTRSWFEVPVSALKLDAATRLDAKESELKWFPYNKGGLFRRWFGNHGTIVNWQHDGKEIKKAAEGASGGRIVSEEFFFRASISWSKVSTGKFAIRCYSPGSIFDVAGPSIFTDEKTMMSLASQLNSKTSFPFIEKLSPTINYEGGQVQAIPVSPATLKDLAAQSNGRRLLILSKSDWDAYETSWDFTTLPLLSPDHRADTLGATYARLRVHWQDMTDEMQRLEEENNRIFINAYGLQDELVPEVPIEEITLTCNPAYSIKGDMDAATREAKLLSRTIAEFLHYAVGCMFGRYSLDAPGLVLANQGEGLADYLARNPNPSFVPDEDNVIPVLDGEWFADDVTERFRKFLQTTFGEEYFQENLNFIERVLSKSVRKWFVRDFYKFHVQNYKKRPIYWMFSSPNGTFNSFIYMHRYRPDTVSVLLNDYVREFRRKLEGERERLKAVTLKADVGQGEKTKAHKDITTLNAQIQEMEAWERDVLLPLAQQKIEIDLDDGVKVNYPKFGKALKPIPGLGDTDD